jgi:hypothetical protein
MTRYGSTLRSYQPKGGHHDNHRPGVGTRIQRCHHAAPDRTAGTAPNPADLLATGKGGVPGPAGPRRPAGAGSLQPRSQSRSAQQESGWALRATTHTEPAASPTPPAAALTPEQAKTQACRQQFPTRTPAGPAATTGSPIRRNRSRLMLGHQPIDTGLGPYAGRRNRLYLQPISGASIARRSQQLQHL